jgi:C-terminal processing protease CtpA/Prc
MFKTNEINAKENLIKSIVEQLEQHYVFPEVANEMIGMIKRNFQDGVYSNLESMAAFCEALTDDMFNICNDKHLKVIYRDEQTSINKEKNMQERLEEEMRRGKVENYGFHKVERLMGNIGYIDLRRFYGIDLGAETVIHAMNFIANTDALIIDLRKNGGGRVDMIPFLTSYLLEESTHINSIYNRSDDTLIQMWTQKYVPGRKYLNKPIYILTSNYTFSGGEEFAYNLKHLKLGKVIGEVTGGGAHPVIFTQITENVRFKIPNRRSINPITHSNWEGTGVIPDVQMRKEKAFNYAYKEALSLVKIQYDDDQNYQFLIKDIEAALENFYD